MAVLAPDGSSLSVEGAKERFLGAWAFMFWVSGQSSRIRMHTGNAGSLEATEEAVGQLDQYRIRRARHGGAELIAMEMADPALTTFVWKGQHHELTTTMGGVDVPFEAFLDVLSRLDLVDSSEGLQVRPRAGSGMDLTLTLGVNTLADVCAVTVKPLEPTRRLLPSHAGRRVRGGTMWHEADSYGGVPVRRALIAGRTTVTTLETRRPDDARFVDVVENLAVDLVPAR